MGRTIEALSVKTIGKKSIFDERFVIELCEKAHIHYRNLRIVQSLDDFINTAEAFVAALDRWKKRGCPGTGNGQHIELCRRKVAIADESDTVQVNLNENLYNKNEDGIFSEGANFTEEKYIHVKIRDLRLECSISEFNTICEAFMEAKEKMNVSSVA
jgi:hypothetical protein